MPSGSGRHAWFFEVLGRRVSASILATARPVIGFFLIHARQRGREPLGNAADLVNVPISEQRVVLAEQFEGPELVGEPELDLLDLAGLVAAALGVMLDRALLYRGGLVASE
jgi:hypothetical protein